MKKILVIVFNIALLATTFAALSFSGSREKEMLCTEVKIDMKDTLHAGFLNKPDIEKILLTKDSEILGYPAGKINIRNLEEKLKLVPYVKDAEIYFCLNGILNVDIIQRKPVLRVITRSQNTYYLDKEGFIFPATSAFTPHVLIANGYFTEDNSLRGIKSIYELSENDNYREWKDALELAKYIEENPFWKSQLVQVYRNGEGDFELIPRVGAHQIIFGDTDDLVEKFKKLRTLYDEGLKYEGWNKYEKINLKYQNQVICTKR